MKRVWFILLLLLVTPLVSALQAIDAESALVQGNFLEQGERATVFKALPQGNGSINYWSVSVTQNDVIRSIIPLSDKDGAPVPKGVLRTNLISANYLVQRLVFLKNNSSWLVSLTTSNKLEELANAVNNEQFDIDIVSDAVPSKISGDIAKLKGKLSTFSSQLTSASQSVSELNVEETNLFNVKIDTPTALGIGTSYSLLFDKIDSLKSLAAEYDQDVSKAKNAIASSPDLDTTTKSQLIGLLSPLGSNQTLSSAINSYSDVAAENAQRITTELAGLGTKVNALDAEAEQRILRAGAYYSLYGNDVALETYGYSTLEEAVTAILSPSQKSLWENQETVFKLSGAWENAVSALGKKQYAVVTEYASQMKVFVKEIDRAGVSTETSDPLGTDSLITGLAFALGAVAVVLLLRALWKKYGPRPSGE